MSGYLISEGHNVRSFLNLVFSRFAAKLSGLIVRVYRLLDSIVVSVVVVRAGDVMYETWHAPSFSLSLSLSLAVYLSLSVSLCGN